MAILSKGHKPDKFESHNSLKLSFTIQVIIWISLNVNLFFLINFSWHSCSVWDKLWRLNWLWQFLCEGLSSIKLKGFRYSYAYSCTLCEGRISFCTKLIFRKLCRFLFIHALFHSVSYFFFLSWSPFSSLCMVFYAISST